MRQIILLHLVVVVVVVVSWPSGRWATVFLFCNHKCHEQICTFVLCPVRMRSVY